MRSIQDRILDASPELEDERPDELLLRIRKRLFKAFQDGKLVTPFHEIQRHVRMDKSLERPGHYLIVGGEKAFDRNPQKACLIRDDRAWIHFTLMVQFERRSPLSLVAYDFELVFGEGRHPQFVRFDLNPEGHDNVERELRSHAHPRNDDFLIPLPIMTPIEILDIFLDEFRPRNPAKPRA